MTHALKILPEYFKAVELGEKTFEIRKADRPFKLGDKLILQEWDGSKYTGAEYKCFISYIIFGDQFGIKKGFCVLGIKEEHC